MLTAVDISAAQRDNVTTVDSLHSLELNVTNIIVSPQTECKEKGSAC